MGLLKTEDASREVPDGAPIKEACNNLGVPFGCEEGLCGSCEIEVLEGRENLNEKNQAEEDMAMEGNRRLACQCKLMKGEVKIKY